MKTDNNIFILYLKDRFKIISSYIIFASIFSIVFYLYRLPLYTILYAVVICLFITIIITTYDFYTYYKRHKVLSNIKNNITSTMDNLKEPRTLLEKDYQDLIKILYEDKKSLTLQLDKKHTDLIEYFTLWTHQIKTPLSAAHLLVQLKEDESEDIDKQLFEIEQYVDMALEYLRIDDMSNDLKLEKCSLDKLVKTAVKTYSKIFIYKDISLKLEELGTKIITDKKWLIFILKQVLSNALKYTSKGYIRIYLECENILVIEDTGIGIESEDLPRIYDRGFTGYNGRMDKKSTGIGLYLTKKVIDKLSHDIFITSEIDKGTTVKIDLSSKKLEIK